jgi:precorrin-6Y C5,15-methyltransferase (decarboxylating)
MGNVYLTGMGPGAEQYLTKRAIEVIKSASYITGSKRLLERASIYRKKEAGTHTLKQLQQCLEWIDEKRKLGDVCVLVSGDVHYYSLAGTIARSAYDWNVIYLPGISSYQMMAAKIGVTLEDAALCSVHGRNESDGYVAYHAFSYPRSLFLCSNTYPPQKVAQALERYGLCECRMSIGSFLSEEKETIQKAGVEEAARSVYEGFSVVCVENPHPKKMETVGFLRDEDFIRGKVPMTKEEIRILVLHKLGIQPWDCLWDLGGGSGSISIEMARHAEFGEVFGVEYKENAAELMKMNRERFQCRNLHIKRGRIKDVIKELPQPDRVFLGGSEGELREVIAYLESLPRKVHFVMTAVTMETLAEAMALLSAKETFSYTQVQIGMSHMVGSYHTTKMNHPVWIMEVDV